MNQQYFGVPTSFWGDNKVTKMSQGSYVPTAGVFTIPRWVWRGSVKCRGLSQRGTYRSRRCVFSSRGSPDRWGCSERSSGISGASHGKPQWDPSSLQHQSVGITGEYFQITDITNIYLPTRRTWARQKNYQEIAEKEEKNTRKGMRECAEEWKCRRPCLKQIVKWREASYPRYKAVRQEQTVQEERKLRNRRREECNKDFQGSDLCFGGRRRCGLFLLCPCLQTAACGAGPDSPGWLWPVCVCFSFALRSSGRLKTVSFAAGHLRHGSRPPSSLSSAHWEPQRASPRSSPRSSPHSSPRSSPPTAVLFWTGCEGDQCLVFPFKCTVHWLVTFTFSTAAYISRCWETNQNRIALCRHLAK